MKSSLLHKKYVSEVGVLEVFEGLSPVHIADLLEWNLYGFKRHILEYYCMIMIMTLFDFVWEKISNNVIPHELISTFGGV